MIESDNPVKLSHLSKDTLQEEIEGMRDFKNDSGSWNNCYFHRVNSDLTHEKGTCSACDWNTYINNVSDEDADNYDYIEAWEWDDIWTRRITEN
jgi:hypothetical protein